MKHKILITGANGFLGTNLINKLKKKNTFIIDGLVSLKTNSHRIKLKKKNLIRCNLENYKDLKKKIIKNYDYVINFAGNINHADKKENLKVHFRGLKNLVKTINKKKLKLFLQIGSSMEYGLATSPHTEDMLCKPNSNYGKVKYLASNFVKKNLINYIILRPYQIYGPFQKKNRLIPIIIDSCLQNSTFGCTHGRQYRDFLYVDDFINLILKILKKNKPKNGIYNVGSGKTVKVKKVINLIRSKIRKGYPKFGKVKLRKDEANTYFPKISKVKKNFNWEPKINLKKGIEKTIKHYAKI